MQKDYVSHPNGNHVPRYFDKLQYSSANLPRNGGYAPQNYDFKLWTLDPMRVNSCSSAGAGNLYIAGFSIGTQTFITQVIMNICENNQALKAPCRIGLYAAPMQTPFSGSLLTRSCDCTAYWATSGSKKVPLSPILLPAGTYYLSVLASGANLYLASYSDKASQVIGNFPPGVGQYFRAVGPYPALPLSLPDLKTIPKAPAVFFALK